MTARLAMYGFRIAVALVFLRASARKFLGVEETVGHFRAWGYPTWLLYSVAAIELIGALLLISPRTSRPAAVLLMPVMLGAIATLVTHGEPTRALLPLCFLGTLAVIALWRGGRAPVLAEART